MGSKLPDYGYIVWNYLVHHAKAWLPYGAILLILAGVWFCWDGPASDEKVVIRETKNQRDSSSPSVSQAGPVPNHSKEKTNSKGKSESKGKRIYSLSGTQRHRPLPNLFAAGKGADAVPAAAVPEAARERPEAAGTGQKKEKQTQPAAEPLPIVCGVFEDKGRRLVLLQNQKLSQICAAGEAFGTFQITYIGSGAVGLVRGGESYEVYY